MEEDRNWRQYKDIQINDLFNLNDFDVEEGSEWQEIAYEDSINVFHEERTALNEQHKVNIYHHHHCHCYDRRTSY
jgi:hypothetical protein